MTVNNIYRGIPGDSSAQFNIGDAFTTAQNNDDSLNASKAENVNSVAALKLLDKTKITSAETKGYYTAGDGGHGKYRHDASDTTSADNGGTVIVGADGARWKLLTNGIVSVRQFGARVNGATDDTAAIQAALDSNVNHILLGQGSSLIVGTLWLRRSFVTIEGLGTRNSILTRGGDTGAVIRVAIATEDNYIQTIVLKHFSVNSNIAGVASYPEIQLQACLESEIEDVRVIGTSVQTAIKLDGALQLVLKSLFIRLQGTWAAGRCGLKLDVRSFGLGTPGNCGTIKLSDSEIDTQWLTTDVAQSPMDYAIHVLTADGLMIENTRVGGAHTANLFLDATDGSKSTYQIGHIEVVNCFFDMVKNRDVLLSGTSRAAIFNFSFNNTLFSGATSANPSLRAFDLQGNASDIRVTACRFWNCGSNAILIQNTISDMIINGNTFKYCNQSNISANGVIQFASGHSGSNFEITGNIIDGAVIAGGAASIGYGVSFKSGATTSNVNINGGRFYNNLKGIQIDGGTNINVDGVNLVGNTSAAYADTTGVQQVPSRCTGYNTRESGLINLAAGTANVSFAKGAFPSANFAVSLATSSNETLRWSSRSTTGFTITSSNAASTATVTWSASAY